MSLIEQSFASLRSSGRKGIVPYITAGFPDLDKTRELIVELAHAGATAIEVGVPFSDPMADGPVIQRACEASLKRGTTLHDVLRCIADAKREVPELPVVLFSYLNPLLQYGLARLADECPTIGVDGVLVTDLPADAAGPFAQKLRNHDVDFISLIAPTSTEERLRQIAEHASGFIYAVSRAGVTGTQEELSRDAQQLVSRMRRFTSIPVALGFGISSPAQATAAWSFADAVVVGSALVKLIEQNPEAPAQRAAEFLTSFCVPATVAAVRGK